MSKSKTVWVVDDDKSIRWVIEKALQKNIRQIRCFENAKELLVALKNDIPDALITDIRMPNMNGLELLYEIQAIHPELPVIVMTAHSDLDSAVSAFHSGAFDYLPKPFDVKHYS
jgi:two-component system nitrogen regulation response regulator GlnG